MQSSQKRDVVQEIVNKYSSGELRKESISYRFQTIDKISTELYSRSDSGSNELCKYIPVAAIACLEWYFRLVYKELIDYGSPYTDNAGKLKDLKFDFQIVKAIQGMTITLGDFIAHMLPLSRVDHVFGHMDTLLGNNFKNELIEFYCRENTDLNTSSIDARQDFEEIVKSVHTLFELRHKYCHEISNFSQDTTDKELIMHSFTKMQRLIRITDGYIEYLLYPDTPKTQAEINVLVSSDLTEINKLLEKTLEESRVDLTESQQQLFHKAQSDWLEYREAYSELKASFYEGGPIQPAIHGLTKIGITESRVKELKQLHEV